MSLVEAVTIELGSALAKAILKVWLKNSTFGDDISSSLLDVLKTHTSDLLVQHKGRRQFERVGEMVGETLFPIFVREGAKLDDGSKFAIAMAVRDTINTLSSSLLAANDLDPTELAKQLLNANTLESQHFDAAETELYHRIIQVSSSYIIDIASQLPAFNERTFAEVLKRETLLIERTKQILEETRRIREWLGPTEVSRFEEDYRKAVARKLDELQLFGTDVSRASQRHRLSVAYITLSVNLDTRDLMRDRDDQDKEIESTLSVKQKNFLDTSDLMRDRDDQDKGIESQIVPVNTALAGSRYLLISGAAGSGKTTLLNWIAVKSALKEFDDTLWHWKDSIPFYIRLRSLEASDLPKPETFPELIAPLIADTMPHGWVHAQLGSGRAIVLIDGVDEVGVQQREEVRTWLKDMLATYPKAYFIVTSRPHAIEEGWTHKLKFQVAELQAMQLSDIDIFIDHWHQAVREELREEEEKADLVSLAKQLKANIKFNRSLYNLATNPLLCAMLCALNLDRRQQLPTDRIELYEACISLLLERRDKERRVDLREYPALNYRQKRFLLQDLAYWMIKNNLSETTLEQVDERFERKLKDMPGIIENCTGLQVRRLFIERTGLIREPVAKYIDFTHRTFEEFLAAHAAIDEVDIGLLISNAQNDQWREVIILACGLAAKQMREELINGLIDRGDTEKDYHYRYHLLAVSCLETAIELGEATKTKVEQLLSKLVPPKDMTEAKALAAAGELAVTYLSSKYLTKKHSSTVAASCVRTLALIGGNAALEIITEFKDDTRAMVVEELIRAWDYFDRKVFARNILNSVLQNNSYLISSVKSRLPSLEGFQYFTWLTSLNLSGCSQISDLSPLASLTNLRIYKH